MLRNISISKRIYLLLAFGCLLITCILLAMLRSSHQATEIGVAEIQQQMIAGQKEKIANSTHALAISMGSVLVAEVQEMIDQEQQKKIQVATHSVAASLGEALKDAHEPESQQRILRAAVDNIRYEPDKSGYFFVVRGTRVVAHPINKHMNGKDVGAEADKNGVAFFREMEKQAQSGGGFVQYVFNKPGMGDTPKVSYAEMIPGTDYWIATGVYLDNIEAAKAKIRHSMQSAIQSDLNKLLLMLGAVILLVVLPGCLLLVRSIVSPLHMTTEAAERIAAGELGLRLEAAGHDEVTRLEKALNAMVATIHANMEGMREEKDRATDLAVAAEHATQETRQAMARAESAKREGLRDAAMRLEDVISALRGDAERILVLARESQANAGQQNARMAENASAMTQMNATVLEVARSASEAAKFSGQSRSKADEGLQTMQRSIQAVDELNRRTMLLKGAMESLGSRAQSIGQIMTVITDIADQTNLLALNAAIEAARAGDAGRGFAVVADEVRKLAEKTMSATTEVGTTILAIQEETNRNLQAMNEAGAAIGDVLDLTAASGQSLNQIVRSIDEASGQVQSIAAATEEQSAASEEISHAIEAVSSLAERTADGMRQASAVVEQIAGHTARLGQLLDDLRHESS